MSRLPIILYRAFKEPQYGEEFVKLGKFRLGLMETYKSIEDLSRQDTREGESSSYIKTNVMEVGIDEKSVSGRLHILGSFIGPIYLMCTAAPNVDLIYLREQFGNWIVRINDPSRFLSDLRNAMPTNRNVELDKCSLEAVSYTKDEDVGIDPDSFEAVRLNWTQKLRNRCRDCEYRYVVKTRRVVGQNPDPYLSYDFNAPIRYAEILEHGL